MNSIIIPHYRRSSDALTEYLRDAGGERRFRNIAAMTRAFGGALQLVSDNRGMKNEEIIDALLHVIVSFVQAGAPKTEWANAGEIICESIKERLTIVDDR